jgi:multidrug efflux pump subunit AcrB
MQFSSWFIGRPIATSLLMVSLLGAGLAVYPLLPVAPLPRSPNDPSYNSVTRGKP